MIATAKLEKLLEALNSYKSSNNFVFEIQHLKELLSPDFVSVYDCILISKKSVEVLEQSFNKAIEMYGDRTGYEASNTEMRINDYIDNENLNIYDILSLTMLILDCWSAKLKQIDCEAKFCFIISCDSPYVTLRYHKFRETEGTWLLEDINQYEGAVGYLII